MSPIKPDHEAFGQRLRELRTAAGFTLREFARQVPISATFVSKMELGEFAPPSEEKIRRMAELLKADADELIFLAKRVPTDLSAIVQARPTQMASFLRTAQKMQPDELEALLAQMKTTLAGKE